MEIPEDLSACAGAAMDTTSDDVYLATQSRLYLNTRLARRMAQLHWLYRLTYNAMLDHEQGFARARVRAQMRGQIPPPRRPSFFQHTTDLRSLREDTVGGPALPEATQFPVVVLRAAAQEAYDAYTQSIRRWTVGVRCRPPHFRSAHDRQTVKISAFAIEDIAPQSTTRTVVQFRVKGLGRLRVRLSRLLPVDHAIIQLHLIRDPDGRIALNVVSKGPAPPTIYDPAAVGRRIHAAVQDLPETASNLEYIHAVQAAGIVVRAGDGGVLAPVATSDGLCTQAVRRPRSEVAVIQAFQRADAQRSRRGKHAKRSKQLLALRKRAQRAHRKGANRRKTRAYQDAALVARGQTTPDPTRTQHAVGHPFLQALRCVPAVTPSGVKADPAVVGPSCDPSAPAMLTVMECRSVERGVVQRCARDAGMSEAAWQRRRARNTARRILETGMANRIRRVTQLSRGQGGMALEVDPRGTSQECAGCDAVVPKDLSFRIHNCPQCGLVVDRDVHATWNILGRGLRQFRTTADPGGHLATAQAAAQTNAARRAKTHAIRQAQGRKRRKVAVDPTLDVIPSGGTSKARAMSNGGVVTPDLKCQGDVSHAGDSN